MSLSSFPSIRPALRGSLRAALVVAMASIGSFASAQALAQTLRIGYQKSASLFVLQKAQGTLEKRLAALKVGLQGLSPEGVEAAVRRYQFDVAPPWAQR